MRNSPKVAIVGYGPSAMYAILACNHRDIKPDLYAKNFTIQPGAFWLKWLPFPESDSCPSYEICIMGEGSRENYINKQWTYIPLGYRSSFPDIDAVEKGYNPHEVMTKVFSGDLGKFRKIGINYFFKDEDLLRLSEDYDLVFHTFPTEIARNDAERVVVQIPIISYPAKVAVNTVIYDGSNLGSVVRSSFLFGTVYHEYSTLTITDKALQGIVSEFNKSGLDAKLSIHYDIRPTDISPRVSQIKPNVFPIGRLALLSRTVLAHDAFQMVHDELEHSYDL